MKTSLVAKPGRACSSRGSVFRSSKNLDRFQPHRPAGLTCSSSRKDSESTENVGLGLKSVWIGAEALGNLVGATRSPSQNSSDSDCPQQQTSSKPSSLGAGPISRSNAIAALKADYDVNYFVSGAGDLSAYDPQCKFADPFASFRGVDRFKRNVSNLGGMMRDVKLDISEWKEEGDTLRTKWRFSAILDLPWKPRLAAAGGTIHVFDPATGKVVEHIESWSVSPGEVVKSLLKPSSTVPTSQWDVLMNAVYAGDVKGIWLATSSKALKLAGVLLAVSFVAKLVTGEGLPGSWLVVAVLVSGVATEVLKFATGMQGEETGTGGRF